MFDATKAFSGFAVRDIEEARAFYAQTLGLTVTDEQGMLRISRGGGTDLLAYAKDDHVPATYTILNFPVDDIDAAVDELVGRGVTFEQYDGFDQDHRGIMREDGPAIAWFTDPSGNVLSVLKMP